MALKEKAGTLGEGKPAVKNHLNTRTIPHLRYPRANRIWHRFARWRGVGPQYYRIGRTIRYDVRDLDAWLELHRVETRI